LKILPLPFYRFQYRILDMHESLLCLLFSGRTSLLLVKKHTQNASLSTPFA